jgi:hypothetical protein
MPSLLCFSLYKLQWLAKRLVRLGQEKNYVKSTHHVQYSGNCVGHKLFLYIIHYWNRAICLVPQALGKGPETLGK